VEQSINERFIAFSGSKAGGSQRLPVPFDLEIGEDVPVTIKGHIFLYNVVKTEFFDNNDGTVNVVYLLKHTGE
jgi:hypothetical protein